MSSLSSYLSKKNMFVKIGQLGQTGGSLKYTPTLFLYPWKNGAEPPRSNKTPIIQKVTGIFWKFWHGWKVGDRAVNMRPWYPTYGPKDANSEFLNRKKKLENFTKLKTWFFSKLPVTCMCVLKAWVNITHYHVNLDSLSFILRA